MIIDDRLYGSLKVTSSLVVELIHSASFQRLKQIAQFGIPNDYYQIKGFSRYEHSLGVYMLLNKLAASQEEQLAGLLHDVSHTAFSHLIDWVIGDSSTEDYQDNRHVQVVTQGDIAQILIKYGFSPSQIANFKCYKLLERRIPNLCADRLDYSLRELSQEKAHLYLDNIQKFDNNLVFTNKEIAYNYAVDFLELQTDHWAGYEATTRYVLLSQMLKKALELNLIALDDFSKTDNWVLSKILNSKNNRLVYVLDVLKQRNLSSLPKQSITTRKKFRHVDPLVLNKNKIRRLSQVSWEYKGLLATARLDNEIGIHVGTLDS